MNRSYYLLHSICCISLCATFLFPLANASAQQPITQSQIDTLLTVNKEKTKIVHINGGWCRLCFQMMTFVDYLNEHKPSNIDITVVFTNSGLKNNKLTHKEMLYWLKERGIDINYFVMSNDQYLESSLYHTIPTTYFIHPKGNLYRHVSASDKHKQDMLYFIEEDVPKSIEAVDSLYKQRKEDLRKTILYEGKKYEMDYSEIFTLQGNKGAYDTHLKVYKGNVIHITANGSIKLGEIAGYTTPNGLSNGLFSAYSWEESVNHGKLLAVLYDENDKVLEGFDAGTALRFKATTNGTLLLKINDNDYQNNQGQFEGTISRYTLAKD